MKLAFDELLTRPLDPFQDLSRQDSTVVVATRSRQLHHPQATHQIRVVGNGNARDMEVVHGPGGLNAVVSARWHVLFTQKVALEAEVLSVFQVSPSWAVPNRGCGSCTEAYPIARAAERCNKPKPRRPHGRPRRSGPRRSRLCESSRQTAWSRPRFRPRFRLRSRIRLGPRLGLSSGTSRTRRP